MAHDHAHGGGGHAHAATPAGHDRAFALGITLNLTYVVIEVTFGLLAGSLALLADAGHNLSDVLGLALAWGAAWLARRQPTPNRTYGYRRSSILAALANAVLLLVAVGAIVVEAVRRMAEPAPVDTGIILWVAAAGVVVNFGTALLFLSGRRADINIRGAFLHMMADGAVTVGVIIAALLIARTGWLWVDPAVCLIIALVIVIGTWGLLRDSLNLSLDAVPSGIDPAAVRGLLTSHPGVHDVHDLHIWAMSTTEPALTAHLVVSDPGAADVLLDGLRRSLRDRFGIAHVTIQIEQGDPSFPCPQAAAHAI